MNSIARYFALAHRSLARGSCHIVFVLLVTSRSMAAPTTTNERPLVAWRTWPTTNLQFSDAGTTIAHDGWLRVKARTQAGRAGVTVKLPPSARNLESFAEVAVPVRNLGTNLLRLVLQVGDASATVAADAKSLQGSAEVLLSPDPQPMWLVVPLGDAATNRGPGRFRSMVGQPCDFVRRGVANGASVTTLAIFASGAGAGHEFAVGPVVARGVPASLRDAPEERVFPLFDEFGQYVHRGWLTKIHSESDFAAHEKTETADLAAHPRPENWNRYGGWADGPKHEATGFFRVEKQNGVWWMVDPEGRLFWSHGVVRVGTRIRVGGIYHGTPLPDREKYFRLPAKDSPLGMFYGTEPQSTRGYYVGRDNHVVYDHLEANLTYKYGAQWPAIYATQAQRRLASWGLNSIANSSDPAIYLKRQTPYTAIVYSAPLGQSEFRLAGSTGNWGKLPDPFDPGWRKLIDLTLRTDLGESLNDPWCLGFFVDNELHWGEATHLAEATLHSPREQPAKRAFRSQLQNKYSTIKALNDAWSTQHESWDAWLTATILPDSRHPAVRTDLETFSEEYLVTYFRGCRDAIKAASPNHLYLGCRFSGSGNALVMRIAARYCDVVSINRYTREVKGLSLPEGLDRPILVGEFHFCTMDSPLHPAGLVLVANHADRARAYRTYVESALRNAAIIGTHWFQFYDQPSGGRFDGENYQTGLLDIADTPYEETISACRQIGKSMYQLRVRMETH
jgi:hypothetical protein